VKRIGRQGIAFESPDLIHVVVRGEVSLEEIRELIAFIKEAIAGSPYLLLLGDLSAFQELAPGVRRVAMELSRSLPYRGVALIGGSVHGKVIAKLLLNALNLFTQRDIPVRFFATEVEAYAWLLERRRVLTARPDR